MKGTINQNNKTLYYWSLLFKLKLWFHVESRTVQAKDVERTII